MNPNWSLPELAEMLAEIERALTAQPGQAAVLKALTGMAVDKIAPAEFAGVTLSRGASRTSVAPTSDLVLRVDEIQYRISHGPCVDAIDRNTRFNVADLRCDERWPDFGREAAARTGILSMLAFRLYTEDDPDVDAALNLYSSMPSAFGDADEAVGLLLATAGALAVCDARARERAGHLERALENSRTIGVAMGILMGQHKITREQAFDLLRLASQTTNRKLADVAGDVQETGALPELPRGRQAEKAR